MVNKDYMGWLKTEFILVKDDVPVHPESSCPEILNMGPEHSGKIWK